MTMRRAASIRPAAQVDPSEAFGTVTLTAHDRHRRRIRMVDDGGAEFLLDLPNAAYLRDGDGLVLDGGGLILVRAAAEEVADIHARTPELAVRIAWHVGNRHVPVQVLPDGALRLQDDPVLLAMLEGLGARIVRHSGPFQPEPGAYDPHGLLSAPEPLVRRA
ncbi:MAG: urease accessory protein UreE [Magnetospirillum sp.]|nr:urease accessory protein UreE [Magnetospirillum sp.]